MNRVIYNDWYIGFVYMMPKYVEREKSAIIISNFLSYSNSINI